MQVAAVPDDMRRYGRVACDAGEAVRARLGRRTLPVLVSFPVVPGLEHRLLRLLEGSCAVDHWVTTLAEAFAAADRVPFVGPLRPGEAVVDDTTAVAAALVGCGLGAAGARRLVAPLAPSEALAAGRIVAARVRAMTPALSDDDVRSLRRQLAPLRDRIREPYREAVADAYVNGPARMPAFPADYGEVMQALAVPGPRQASLFGGFAAGVVAGSWGKGYDSVWGEVGRGAGHILTGFLLVGDIRDATADIWHHRWFDAGVDAVGLVPVFGDLVKGGRTAWRFRQGFADAADTAHRLQQTRRRFDITVRATRNAAAKGPC